MTTPWWQRMVLEFYYPGSSRFLRALEEYGKPPEPIHCPYCHTALVNNGFSLPRHLLKKHPGENDVSPS